MNYLNGIYVQKAIQKQAPSFIQKELEAHLKKHGTLSDIEENQNEYIEFLHEIMLEKFEISN